jgi:hypothetical protein
MKLRLRDLRRYYESAEYLFGVGCPLLSVLSVLDATGMVHWVWLLFFWMACGHFALYSSDTYPSIRYRPFARGLFAFGVGVAWPVWCTLHRRKKNLWVRRGNSKDT